MKIRIFVALVFLFLLLPYSALAQGGWITIPAQAFINAHSDNHYDFHLSLSGDGECYLYIAGPGNANFVAPVVFPPEADGLSVRQMNATVGDFVAGLGVQVGLFRLNRFSGITKQVFYVGSGSPEAPGKTVITDTTGGYRLIDNKKYAWSIYFVFEEPPTPATDLRFYAVRIKYQ